MQRYKSDHNSGVAAYEVGEDFIIIEFQDGRQYLYNNEKPGISHINKMKNLAKKGKHLTTYINQHVRENFKKRLK